jgi:type VI secretion system protein ImpL
MKFPFKKNQQAKKHEPGILAQQWREAVESESSHPIPWILLLGGLLPEFCMQDEALIFEVPLERNLDKNALQVLKKVRPRLPLDGVLLTLSLQSILEDGLQDPLLDWIRQCLETINRTLGILVPVAIVITDCDCLPSFQRYFNDLDEVAMQQPWGMPWEAKNWTAAFSALKNRLVERGLHRLTPQTDLLTKQALLSFPQEWEEAAAKLLPLLETLSHRQADHEAPRCTGLYFTAASARGSYFSHDFFHQMISKPSAPLKNKKGREIQKKFHHAAGLASLFLIITLGCFLWSGYAMQKSLYAQQEALTLQFGRDPVADTLLLGKQVHALQALESQHLWRFRLGINSLKTQIKQNEGLFLQAFTRYLLPKAMDQLKRNLEQEGAQWARLNAHEKTQRYALYYDKLKAYLMLEQRDRLDPHFAGRILAPPGEEAVFVSALKLWKMNPQHLPLLPLDQARVQTARDHLSITPDPKELYQHLVTRGKESLGTSTLTMIIGKKDQGLLRSPVSIPTFYTRAAYKDKVLPLMQEMVDNAGKGDWVLQTENNPKKDRATQAQWLDQIRALYFQDYLRQWEAWMNTVEIRPFHSLDDAVAQLGRLEKKEGPLVALIEALLDNLSLPSSELSAAREEIKSMQGEMPAYLKQVGQLRAELSELANLADPLRASEGYARKILAEDQDTPLRAGVNALQSKPTILNALRAPYLAAWSAILDTAGMQIQQTWEAEVLMAYQQSLRGKFPFSAQGAEASLEDVSAFFNPKDGVMTQFADQVLSPYVKYTKSGWVEQRWLGKGLGFSKKFLTTLSQAEEIRHGLFHRHATEPSFHFYIQPIPSPGVEELVFEASGQETRYRNEPEEWHRFAWPGEESHRGSLLRVRSTNKKLGAELDYSGPWGLFRLLSEARWLKQGQAQVIAEWHLRDRNGDLLPVKMKIKAEKESAVLDPKMLRDFSLPEKIGEEG